MCIVTLRPGAGVSECCVLRAQIREEQALVGCLAGVPKNFVSLFDAIELVGVSAFVRVHASGKISERPTDLRFPGTSVPSSDCADQAGSSSTEVEKHLRVCGRRSHAQVLIKTRHFVAHCR